MSGKTEVLCSATAGFYGQMGIAAAVSFGCLGSAYGTAKSSAAISSIGATQPEKVMRALIPVVMSGIVAIYGLILSIVISSSIDPEGYPSVNAYIDLGAGLAVGLAGTASGMCIGIAGDAGVRAFAREARVYVALVLILIFGEALGLYGLIIGIVMNSKKMGKGNFKCVYDLPWESA